MVDVQQPEAAEIVAANLSIGTPNIAEFHWDGDKLRAVRVKADDLRKWRALRNPPTSSVEQT